MLTSNNTIAVCILLVGWSVATCQFAEVVQKGEKNLAHVLSYPARISFGCCTYHLDNDKALAKIKFVNRY